MKPIRVLVVDDHEMLRRGLVVFLRSFEDMLLAGEAKNGREALELCQQNPPDVVLMDLMMPEMDGISTTRAIARQFPGVRVIVLTSADDAHHINAALQAGATSYLLKNASTDDLARAIRAAHAGKRTLSPEITETLIQTTTEHPAPISLSERETHVLRLMVAGMNNLEIAAQLSVSRSTVKFHVSSILAKLGVKNRLEAVKLALEYHLLD